ncbi:MAG TPA: pseudouridine-5'-phosphate glycosidase [Mycobacteriales bacterium]|nr:pseudouridine-5'-phosphate glycosidase [Mycobacteriales bacterium]
MTDGIQVEAEVAAALAAGRPVVALESTLLAHGLPAADSPRVAAEMEAAVRAAGAVPATIAVLAGEIRVGLDGAALARVTAGAGLAKLSVRDLPAAIGSGADGATTVAATAAVAARAGIGVFATGGLGGVHRDARESFDESADLPLLARTPIAVVCSGVKSILDIGATLERLETLSVTVLGYGTDRFPGFYLTDSGHPVAWRVDTPAAAAAVLTARDRLGLRSAVLLANPVPAAAEIDPALHDRVLADALAAAAADGIHGAALTPYLLDRMHRGTAGASLTANIALVLSNATLAGQVAAALADHSGDR